MIADSATPPATAPASGVTEGPRGVCYSAARWTSQELDRLARHLAERGGPLLRGLDTATLLAAWQRTVEVFRNPSSLERRALDPALSRLLSLSPRSLSAGLEAVLGGVAGDRARAAARRAEGRHGEGLLAVVLTAFPPALAVQPLLPALLLRRPVLLKSARSEPLFAPAFVRTLVGHCPELGEVVAAVTWRGGDRSLEERAFGPARQLLAYGRTATLEALGDRGPALLDYGPKISLAAVDASVEPREVAPGLARDVALFEQRSCLSIHAVYTAGDPRLLADALAGALRRLAETWPPGPLDPVVAAQLQQLRSEARMRGLHLPDLELREGTVVVDPLPAFRPSPGGRCVRVHPLADLAELPHRLELWRGRLQGMALAGAGADALRGALEDLGVSRTAPPGRLQAADASWQNGGRDLLEVLSGG